MTVFTKSNNMQAILVSRNCRDEILIQMTFYVEDVHVYVLMIGWRMNNVGTYCHDI